MTATATKHLNDFEGREVQRATVKITNAGDGLSEALGIDPEEIELDDERFYILRAKCGRVSVETDKNGITSRVHTMKTEHIATVDADLASDLLSAAARSLQEAKDAASGQQTLDDAAESERLMRDAEDEAARKEGNK